MAMVDADWSVTRSTKAIRYEGDDHTLDGGTPSYATVIQFHRWLQNLADDPEFSPDDELDIIDLNPSDRSTDNIITLKNGFNIDATAAEHLYDGTIIQGSNKTEERWDGIVNFGQPSAHIQVIQDGAVLTDDFWNYGYQAGTHTPAGSSATVMTDTGKTWTTDEWVGYTIKNVTDVSQGIITENTADTITVAYLYGGTDDTWQQNDVYHIAKPLNGDVGQGISHRFMLKTRDNGVDIDRRRLIGTTRRYGNTYAEFKINGTSQGNNVLALSDSNDLNNNTDHGTLVTAEGLNPISNTEGLRLIDIDDNGTDEEYYSEWDRATHTINTFYEWLKLISADSTTETLNSLGGELFRGITHSYAYDGETGTNFTTNDVGCWGTNVVFTTGSGTAVLGEEIYEDTATPVWKGRVVGIDDNTGTGSIVVDVEFGTVTNAETFSTTNGFAGTVSGTPAAQNSAGRGIIFAVDDDGVAGNMYMQILAGIAPVNDTRIYFGNATADVARYHDVNVTIVDRAISTPFVGQSTGAALIGSYGLGLQKADTAAADTYFDLGANAITPPNNVTFTASGFAIGDYVLCTEDNGNDINFTQMVSDGTDLTGAAVTVVGVAAIPSDTPGNATTIGGIRIERDSGLYSLHRYSAVDLDLDEFTIPSHNFSTDNATHPFNVFVSYLDLVATATSHAFSYVYSSDRTHFLRVRNGATPIKDAFATGDMTNTGGSAAVNTVSDA